MNKNAQFHRGILCIRPQPNLPAPCGCQLPPDAAAEPRARSCVNDLRRSSNATLTCRYCKRGRNAEAQRAWRPPVDSADILNDVDSRASDKIPGARVRVKRHVPAQPSSGARPREWLALADGVVQEARTEGPALALIGQPLPYQPGRAERRSGVPAEVITSDRVPNSCTCSWAYSQGKLTLKHYNAACPVHLEILGR